MARRSYPPRPLPSLPLPLRQPRAREALQLDGGVRDERCGEERSSEEVLVQRELRRVARFALAAVDARLTHTHTHTQDCDIDPQRP